MEQVRQKSVSAIVVAAGLSTRMGQPKQLLPYGDRTVIEQIVAVLQQCLLQEIVVVTGHERQSIECVLARWPVRPIFNPYYRTGEMLTSVQQGLLALPPEVDAALIVLGDQPQIEAGVVRQLIETYQESGGRIVLPSFRMRRGHPILIDRTLWPAILTLAPGENLRQMINNHSEEIHYVVVETDSVLRDIDTPEEYQRELRRLKTQNR